MKRSSFISGASTAAMLAAAAPVSAQTASITIGQNAPSSSSWPLLVAQELGFFKRYGLGIETVNVSSTAAAAQQAIVGAVDLAVVSTSQLIEAVQGGAPLKLYCYQLATAPYTLLAQKDIKRYADLKGKTIVVGGVNDATRIFAEKMIASGGLGPQDYEEVYVGATSDRYAALKSGSVAAAILLPPSVFSAIDEGFVPLGTLPAVMPVFPYTGYVGRADLATKKPEILAAFMKGYLRGVRWLDNPANAVRAAAILSAATNSSADVSRRTYDEVVMKSNCFPKDGKLVPKQLQIVADTLLHLNVIKPPVPVLESLIDDRFVTAANAQLSRERA